MASFVYTTYITGIITGFAHAPSSWTYLLVLVKSSYTPVKATDVNLASIGAGNIANDGSVSPIVTPTLVGNGLLLSLTATNRWLAVAGPTAVNAVVLYGTFTGGNQLIAYYDDWGGLPFTPNGTDVLLNSLPTPLGTGENTYRISN